MYGQVKFFPNLGTPQSPAFYDAVPDNLNPWNFLPSNILDFTMLSCVDIDKDGDKDCFMSKAQRYPSGSEWKILKSGMLYYENTGATTIQNSSVSSIPHYTESTIEENPLKTVNENYPSPTFFDIDGDSDVDCVIGTSEGSLKYYRNYGIEKYCFFNGVFSITDGRCACSSGFSGPQCATQCPGPTPWNPEQICYGHGACYSTGELEGSCLCAVGYAGVNSLNISDCGDCVVSTTGGPSYYGNGTSGVELSCQLCPGGGTCSGHGTCAGGKTGSGSCSCESGWSADSDGSCSVALCAACKVSELREEFATADAYGCTFKCSACPKGGICFGTTNVDPLEGYWTANDASNNVYKCLILGNCEGGTCDTGHNGPICATCIDGWALAAGVCVECAGRTGSPTLWALIVVVILVISFCIVRCFFCGVHEEDSTHKATSSTMHCL